MPDGGKVEGGTPLFKLRKGGNFQEALGCLSADVLLVFKLGSVSIFPSVPQLLPRLLLPWLQNP